MPEGLWQFPLQIPRHAFTLRDVARAGDLWRVSQDAAVTASSRGGWPPARFVEEGTAFVVYRQTVLHHRETRYGEVLDAATWVSKFRRRTLCTREVRFTAGDPVASATQEWVHVDGTEYKPLRASEEAASAFPEVSGDPSVTMPAIDDRPGREHEWSFDMWQTWSDPLGHANHPVYVDWCDEATSRRMMDVGIDPLLLAPVAERVTFKSPVQPGERVRVRTRLAGVCAQHAVALDHEITAGDRLSALATTVRRLSDGGVGLVDAWT